MQSYCRVHELLCQVGQGYESLKEHLPRFEQQRANWLLEQPMRIQQWLENFRGEVVREILSIKNRMSEAQEQALTICLHHPPEN